MNEIRKIIQEVITTLRPTADDMVNSQKLISESEPEKFKILRFPDVNNWSARQDKYYRQIGVGIGGPYTTHYYWNIFNSKGLYVGKLDEDGTLYETTYKNLHGPSEREIEKEVGGNFKDDPKQAARVLFLRRQKPKKLSEMEEPSIRDDRSQSYRVETRKLDGLPGWVAYLNKDIEDNGKFRLRWNIFDERDELVGTLYDEDGALYYNHSGGRKGGFDEDKDFTFPSDVENAARYIFMKRQKPLKEAINESAVVKADGIPWITAFKSKNGWVLFFFDYVIARMEKGKLAPNSVFGWDEKKWSQSSFAGFKFEGSVEDAIRSIWESLEKVLIPNMPKTIAVKNVNGAYWIFELGHDKMIGSLQPDGELFYKTPFKDDDMKADINFKNDPIGATRYLYLKNAKVKKSVIKSGISEGFYGPKTIGWSSKIINVPDVGGWYAIKKVTEKEGRGRNSGNKFEETTVEIYDAKNVKVGTIYADGTLNYRKPNPISPWGYDWKDDEEFWDLRKVKKIQMAIRYVYLKTAKSSLKEAYIPLEIGNEQKFVFPDIGNWSAIKKHDTVIAIYTDDNERVGTFKIRPNHPTGLGILSYDVDPRGLGFGWQKSEEWNSSDIKNAVRYLFLIRQKKNVEKQLNELEGDEIDGWRVKEMVTQYNNEYTDQYVRYWNIYDSNGNNVATLSVEGTLRYETNVEDLPTKEADIKFDPYDKKSLKNAVRYVYLKNAKRKK
jgi:hypothetical protein